MPLSGSMSNLNWMWETEGQNVRVKIPQFVRAKICQKKRLFFLMVDFLAVHIVIFFPYDIIP